MGKMSELAYDVEQAAHVIANDNYDLRQQLAALHEANQRLREKLEWYQKRNSAMFKANNLWAQRYYKLAEDHGIELKDEDD